MKITLMDIMESLNSENMEDAEAALHEWFIEQSKKVHSDLTAGAVEESEEEETEEQVEEGFFGEADDAGKAFRAQLNKAAAVMKKAGVLTPQDEQIIAKARTESSADALQGLNPKAKAMAAKLIKAPAAAGINWEGIQLSGDPKTDAKGWAAIASANIKKFSEWKQNPELDELEVEDMEYIIDCATRALPAFKAGDVEGGLKIMMPDANAQDFLSGNLGPDNYEKFFFHNTYSMEAVAESEETDECEEEKVEEAVEEADEETVEEAIVDEAPRKVDRSHQDVYAELQKIIPTLQNLSPEDQALIQEIAKAVKGRSVGYAIARSKKLDPAVKKAISPAFQKWRGMKAQPAPAAPAPKVDYSDIELIDDDYFEVDDMIGHEIDAGKTSGVVKNVSWSRTGIEGDVVWALNSADIDAIAAQAGYGQADFSGSFLHSNLDDDEEVEFFYKAYNVTGEPQHQSAAESVVEPTFEDLVAELRESFAGLETCSDKLQNVEGAQVGEEGKVSVNTKAALPSHKAKDRVGGEPVEVKAEEHKGYEMEKAPKVVDKMTKRHVQNSKDDPKKVADKGDKSALLNSKKGFGSEEASSPISGKGAKGLKK